MAGMEAAGDEGEGQCDDMRMFKVKRDSVKISHIACSVFVHCVFTVCSLCVHCVCVWVADLTCENDHLFISGVDSTRNIAGSFDVRSMRPVTRRRGRRRRRRRTRRTRRRSGGRDKG